MCIRDRVTLDDETTVFALLEERRANISAQRVRAVNQLHALLRDLIPGGARTNLTSVEATGLLQSVRPATTVERTRKELARYMVRDIRSLDATLADIASRMAEALDQRDTRLLEVDGVGPVLGVRLSGRTGRASRFPTADAYANYAGVAPVEIASGDHTRHRLSRSGDRQLNSALHLVAVTQIRMTNSAGRRYFDKKIAEGKTHREAKRCLKRRIAASVWRIMLADEQRIYQTPTPRSEQLDKHRGTLGLLE